MIRRLIYTSRSLVGTNVEQIDAIVSASIKHNAEADLTGMLWTDRINFAQVLEGPETGIRSTFSRIQRDHRHCEIVVVSDRLVSLRQFGCWAMQHAGDNDAGMPGAAFMVGLAKLEATAAANHLYEIILRAVQD